MSGECGGLDEEFFPKHLVDKFTTGHGEAVLFIINFIFTLLGIFANSFGLVFFIKKERKDISTMLFICLCAIDLATSLTLGPLQLLINVGAINFYDFSTGHFTIFSIFSALSNVEIRFSMFLFMVMSICRCISILTPFRRHNKRLIISILGVYTLLLMVMCFYPVFVCNEFSYQIVPFSRIGQMEFVSGADNMNLDLAQQVYLACMEVITMILPVFPIVVSSSVTAYNLIFSSTVKTLSQNNKSRRDGAITILILTFSTLLCFTPRLAVVLSVLVADETVADQIIDGTGLAWSYHLLYVMITGMSIANSGINPCIFLARGQNMKTYLRKSVVRAYNSTAQAGRRSNVSLPMNNLYANRTQNTDLSNGSCLQSEFNIKGATNADTKI